MSNPEIGYSIKTGDILTNYQDVGCAKDNIPVLFFHGSGPGVSAWVNWKGVFPNLSDDFRLIAPDLAGFGYSEVPVGFEYSREVWLQQIVDFIDALNIEQVHVVGNSFGGSMALALAIKHPDRVRKIVLMGSVGVSFELTPGLDSVWGYEPSFQSMQHLMKNVFAYNTELINDQLVESRYVASLRTQDAFSSMFPAPRQRWIEEMAHDKEKIKGIKQPTLLIHGRDDKVIPLSTSLIMHQLIDNSQLHVFGRCGHWTQIEKNDDFCTLLRNFLKN